MATFVGHGVQGQVREQVPLAPYTTWRIGGPARWLVTPVDSADLRQVLTNLPERTPCLLLGGGSNLLVADNGFPGVVIALGDTMNTMRLERREDAMAIVEAEAGAETRGVAHFARKHGLTGLEFMTGIPGSIGGAVRMNAGAYGGEISQALVAVELMDRSGAITVSDQAALGFGYRHSAIPEGWIVTKAWFSLHSDDPEQIRNRMRAFNRQRVASQPLQYPSAGSTFKNPPGQAAWRLLDQAGLRGHTLGGAQIAEKHCNFFLNRGHATAHEMRSLIALAQEAVLRHTGIALELEVRLA